MLYKQKLRNLIPYWEWWQ